MLCIDDVHVLPEISEEAVVEVGEGHVPVNAIVTDKDTEEIQSAQDHGSGLGLVDNGDTKGIERDVERLAIADMSEKPVRVAAADECQEVDITDCAMVRKTLDGHREIDTEVDTTRKTLFVKDEQRNIDTEVWKTGKTVGVRNIETAVYKAGKTLGMTDEHRGIDTKVYKTGKTPEISKEQQNTDTDVEMTGISNEEGENKLRRMGHGGMHMAKDGKSLELESGTKVAVQPRLRLAEFVVGAGLSGLSGAAARAARRMIVAGHILEEGEIVAYVEDDTTDGGVLERCKGRAAAGVEHTPLGSDPDADLYYDDRQECEEEERDRKVVEKYMCAGLAPTVPEITDESNIDPRILLDDSMKPSEALARIKAALPHLDFEMPGPPSTPVTSPVTNAIESVWSSSPPLNGRKVTYPLLRACTQAKAPSRRNIYENERRGRIFRNERTVSFRGHEFWRFLERFDRDANGREEEDIDTDSASVDDEDGGGEEEEEEERSNKGSSRLVSDEVFDMDSTLEELIELDRAETVTMRRAARATLIAAMSLPPMTDQEV